MGCKKGSAEICIATKLVYRFIWYLSSCGPKPGKSLSSLAVPNTTRACFTAALASVAETLRSDMRQPSIACPTLNIYCMQNRHVYSWHWCCCSTDSVLAQNSCWVLPAFIVFKPLWPVQANSAGAPNQLGDFCWDLVYFLDLTRKCRYIQVP